MKEHPVLFSAPMVRAILDGRKTQTRRVIVERKIGVPSSIKRDGSYIWALFPNSPFPRMEYELRCPFGHPGDRLWVRENVWRDERASNVVIYAATPELAKYDDGTRGMVRASFPDNTAPPTRDFMQKEMESNRNWHLKPSIHMPRWASRITLDITAVRVERIRDISVVDAVAEGRQCEHGFDYCTRGCGDPAQRFAYFWNQLNEKRGYGWDSNPWVWVVEFEQIKAAKAAA